MLGWCWVINYSKIEYTEHEDLCYFDEYIECIGIGIGRTVFRTNRYAIVTVIYRPPNTDNILLMKTVVLC